MWQLIVCLLINGTCVPDQPLSNYWLTFARYETERECDAARSNRIINLEFNKFIQEKDGEYLLMCIQPRKIK